MSTTGDVKRLALGFREDAIYIEIDDRQTGTERRRINRLKSSYEVNFKVLGDSTNSVEELYILTGLDTDCVVTLKDSMLYSLSNLKSAVMERIVLSVSDVDRFISVLRSGCILLFRVSICMDEHSAAYLLDSLKTDYKTAYRIRSSVICTDTGNRYSVDHCLDLMQRSANGECFEEMLRERNTEQSLQLVELFEKYMHI